MKKNFIKKTLASTLAFAMVASVVPVAPAAAAKAPALNKTGKYLYLNENEVGSTFNFNVVNQVKGSTYKWTSADKTIATVNAKTGVVTAKKVGTVKVSCKITLPTKKTKTLTATVKVKENAVKAAIANPTETVKINEEYNFNKSFTTASGGKCTDYQNWVLDTTEGSNTAGATVDAKSGKVTATKAGSFKIKVQAYQNATKLAAGDVVESEWLTVKVNPSVLSVTQNSVTKLTVTFDDNMKDKVKASDFTIKNKATNVVPSVKAVSFSEDGKVVTVETYAQFDDAATYVVTYGGKDFEVSTTIGAVTNIEITTATVVENKETEIKYVLKNANGVDITDAKSSTVSIDEVENKDGWLNGKKLTIFNKGSVAKVKVTYHTYKYATNGTEEGAVTAEATITAVEESAATVGNYKNYVIASSAPNWNKVTENKNVICINETGMKVFLKALDSDKKDVTGLTFSTGNEEILMVTSAGELTAVKEGSTVIVVKNSKGTVLWTLPVVVKAERKATNVFLANSTVKVVSNGIATATTEFKINDQHGDSMDATGKVGNIEALSGAPTSLVSAAGVDSKNVAINAAGVAKGTYQYKVFLKDSTTKFTVLTVVVETASSTTITAHRLDLSDTTVDTLVDADSKIEDKAITIKVIDMAQNLDIAVSGSAYVEIANADGKVVASGSGVINFKYITASGSELVKTAKGGYSVAAYTATDKKTVIARKSFVINDTQSLPTVTVNSTTYKDTNKGNLLQILKDNCKVVSSYGVELKDAEGIVGFDGTASVDGKQYNVKTVTVKEVLSAAKGTYVLHTVNVSKTFTVTDTAK